MERYSHWQVKVVCGRLCELLAPTAAALSCKSKKEQQWKG